MAKQYPTDERTFFLVCEDIRQETGNKITILGSYGAGEILIHEPEKENGALPSLALLFVFTDGDGTFDASMKFVAPDGKEIAVPSQPLEKKVGAAHMNAIIKMAPFPTKTGTYVVTAVLDGKEYQRKFSIRHTQ